MVIKILAIGDPHFQTDNAKETDLFTEAISKIITSEIFDFVVVLGDVLHTHERLHVQPLNRAYNFIKKIRDVAKVFVLVGNHDLCNNQQFLSNNHWMNAMKEWNNVVIVDKVLDFELNGHKFVFSPFVVTGKFQEALETCPGWNEASIIFAHQEFRGCQIFGNTESTSGDPWHIENPMVISGHIHNKHQPRENILYIGAAIQSNFGDSANNTICGITITDDTLSYEEIDLKLPKKLTMDMPLEMVVDNVNNIIRDSKFNNIRVALSGTYDQFKNFKKTNDYRLLQSKGVKIIYRHIHQDDEKISEEPVKFNNILLGLIEEEKMDDLVREKVKKLYSEIFNS